MILAWCWDLIYKKEDNSRILNQISINIPNYNGPLEVLLDLAKEMKDFNFSIVTDKISSCNLKNVNLINGNWREETLSDLEIKNIEILKFKTPNQDFLLTMKIIFLVNSSFCR